MPPRLARLALVRLAAGLLGLGTIVLAGADRRVAPAAFLGGALVAALALGADRRFVRRTLDAPPPPPDRGWRTTLADLLPSTAGVAALTAAAAVLDATLAALLAGVLAGMGLATAVTWLGAR